MTLESANTNPLGQPVTQTHLIREIAPALLTVSELRDVYSRLAPLIQFAERLWECRARNVGIELASARKFDRVLEIGLGAGTALGRIAEASPSSLMVGIDMNRAMIQTADMAAASMLSASATRQCSCECDARSLPFAGSVFDLVFCSYFFDMLSALDIDAAFAEIRRVLKPRGRVVVVHLSARSRWFNFAWRPLYWFIPNLLGGCRPVGLADYLTAAGFRLIEKKSIWEWGIPSEVVMIEPTRSAD